MRPLPLLLGLLALILGGCSKEDPTQVAKHFFEQCQKGQESEAYDEATANFRMEKSRRYFSARLSDIGFQRLKDVQWGASELKDGVTRIGVEITDRDGNKLPLEVELHQETGHWRVDQVFLLPTGSETIRRDFFTIPGKTVDARNLARHGFTEPVVNEIPAEEVIQRLAEDTILRFNDAIQKKDFTEFYDNISVRWKTRGQDPETRQKDWKNASNRLTVTALADSFSSFVEANVDFAKVKGAPFKLEEPARISADGVLTLQGGFDATIFMGTFPAKAQRMSCKLEYIFEHSQWKLFGIGVTLKPL